MCLLLHLITVTYLASVTVLYVAGLSPQRRGTVCPTGLARATWGRNLCFTRRRIRKHDRYFRDCREHPPGSFFRKAGAVDFSPPEEPRRHRSAAARSQGLSNALLRPACATR